MNNSHFDRRLFLQGGAALAASPCFARKAAAQTPQARMLIVSTNVGRVGDSVSGTFLMEIALPFKYFTNAGIVVDIVTPNGGQAEIYHAGEESAVLSQIRNSAAFVARTSHSLAPDRVRPGDYFGIYYPGGHGQFWDVVGNTRIASIAADIHERGGVIGAAGHGMASLLSIRLRDGRYFVAGKRMTAFPWWAERQYMTVSNYGALLPFDMEAVLRERNATVIVPTEATRSERSLTLIVDEPHRLVTGTWATLAQAVAEEMHRLAAAGARLGRSTGRRSEHDDVAL